VVVEQGGVYGGKPFHIEHWNKVKLSNQDKNRYDSMLQSLKFLAFTEEGADFFSQLATHWKQHFVGWSAWVLTPDLKLPAKMRLKESRRVPLWNGPLECRLFRFEMQAGKWTKR
jgi:23S rRNA G2445 N2-methylase RlmL